MKNNKFKNFISIFNMVRPRLFKVVPSLFLLSLVTACAGNPSAPNVEPPPFSNANSLVVYQEQDTTSTSSIVGASTLGLEMKAIPEGKRLVVQHASVKIETNDSNLNVNCRVFGGHADNRFGRVTPGHSLLLGDQYSISPKYTGRSNGYSASQPVTLYIDSGLAPEIGCFFSRDLSSSDNIFIQGTVTGYLTDMQ